MEISLMEKFADPALFETLSTSEKAMGALITTGMGMGITFLVLILLWGVIAVMSKCVNTAGQKREKEETVIKAGEIKVPEVIQADGGELEDTQLIAVIMGAIEAYEEGSGVEGDRFVVRRITRAGGNPWGTAGVAECTASRR